VRSIVIAGARPNFVKVAPLLRAFRGAGIEPVLIHTGQHYDWAMSESLFNDLGIEPPDVNLGIGSGSHAVQTAKVMVAFDEWLDANECDQVVTVGDVNSSMACTLVAAKRHVPVAHVEAGLRAFDRTMPEEINRIVVDGTASWLFTPSEDADENLLAEGIRPERIHLVGNIMVDSLLANLDKAMAGTALADIGITGAYGLVTLHRPALVDDPLRFRGVLAALRDIARDLPLVFPVHPRTRAMLAELDPAELGSGLVLTDPCGYLDFLQLEAGASLVLTDSGGVQEETTVLGVPCLTLRENTERPVTITQGTNRLVGFDADAIRTAAAEALADTSVRRQPPLWDGHTAERVADVLADGTVHDNWIAPALTDRPSLRGPLASVPA
jgi:UDP-N-acetylglucosamine 2-epimerase (non-hydrolysing)